MKSTLALSLVLTGMLLGCQARTPSPAPRAPAPPFVAIDPAESPGLDRPVDATPITPFETVGATPNV